MDIDKIIAFLRKNPAVIVVTTLIVVPATWTLSSIHYEGVIRVLEMQIRWQEQRLKEPAGFTSPSGAVSYPPIKPGDLSETDVENLALFYGLFTQWRVNPQLRFKPGDIGYWYRRRLSESDLKIQFESRRQVLQRAEETGKKIPTQGDLSFFAEQIVRKFPTQ